MLNVDSIFQNRKIAVAGHLATQRYRLERPCLNDELASGLYPLYSDAEVGRYNLWQAVSSLEEMHQKVKQFTGEWDSGQRFRWIIRDKATQEVLGDFVLVKFDLRWKEVEIGFNLKRKFWKRRVMYEVLQRVKEYLQKDLGLERITALVCRENIAALALLDKTGFKKLGFYPKAFRKNDLVSDLLIMQCLNDESL